MIDKSARTTKLLTTSWCRSDCWLTEWHCQQLQDGTYHLQTPQAISFHVDGLQHCIKRAGLFFENFLLNKSSIFNIINNLQFNFEYYNHYETLGQIYNIERFLFCDYFLSIRSTTTELHQRYSVLMEMQLILIITFMFFNAFNLKLYSYHNKN